MKNMIPGRSWPFITFVRSNICENSSQGKPRDAIVVDCRPDRTSDVHEPHVTESVGFVKGRRSRDRAPSLINTHSSGEGER